MSTEWDNIRLTFSNHDDLVIVQIDERIDGEWTSLIAGTAKHKEAAQAADEIDENIDAVLHRLTPDDEGEVPAVADASGGAS